MLPPLRELLGSEGFGEWVEHRERGVPLWFPRSPEREALATEIPAWSASESPAKGGKVRLVRTRGDEYLGECYLGPETRSHTIEAGETLFMDNMAVSYPELRTWERDAERFLQVPERSVVVKQSLSGESGGFPWHFDASDALVLQVQGAKRWLLGCEANVEEPADGCNARRTSDRMLKIAGPFRAPQRWRELVLEPGDLLYIPRGWQHKTIAEDTTALGLSRLISIRLKPPMWLDLLPEPLQASALLERRWRHRSFGGWARLWGEAPGAVELDYLLERDFPEAGLEAGALQDRWNEAFVASERGEPVSR